MHLFTSPVPCQDPQSARGEATPARWLRAAVGLVLVFVVAAMPAIAAHADAETLTSVVASTAQDALRQQVQSQGAIYASDCASTRSPDDLGQLCSKYVARQGNVEAYLTGKVFSEFRQWVFLQRADDGWHLLGTAPYDDSASTPAIPWPSN